jgi:hypothetical protein
MAELKRKVLTLSSGKQIRLYGNSVAISRSLEIGEGYAPNILSGNNEQPGNTSTGVINPYKLTPDELMELADFNIQLWMDLKANIRRFGVSSPRIFTGESGKQLTETTGNKKSGLGSKQQVTE